MTRKQYIDVLADLLSGDPDKIREANEKLYGELVSDGVLPAMAMLEIEQRAERISRSTRV